MNNVVTPKEIRSFICEHDTGMTYYEHVMNNVNMINIILLVMVDQEVAVPRIQDGSLILKFTTSY